MDIQVKTSKQVWWQTTTEYEITVEGELRSVRISENPKGMEFFILEDGVWEELDESLSVDAAIYEAWEEGLFDE